MGIMMYHEVLLDIVGGASGEQNADSMEPIVADRWGALVASTV